MHWQIITIEPMGDIGCLESLGSKGSCPLTFNLRPLRGAGTQGEHVTLSSPWDSTAQCWIHGKPVMHGSGTFWFRFRAISKILIPIPIPALPDKISRELPNVWFQFRVQFQFQAEVESFRNRFQFCNRNRASLWWTKGDCPPLVTGASSGHTSNATN